MSTYGQDFPAPKELYNIAHDPYLGWRPTRRGTDPGLNHSALSGLNTPILKHFRKLQSCILSSFLFKRLWGVKNSMLRQISFDTFLNAVGIQGESYQPDFAIPESAATCPGPDPGDPMLGSLQPAREAGPATPPAGQATCCILLAKSRPDVAGGSGLPSLR